MKTSTKVLIGVGASLALSTAAAIVLSESVLNFIDSKAKRCKVKRFVNEKLDGNDKVLDVVDKLSDDELDTLFSLVDKVKEGKNRISVYGDNVKESTAHVKEAFNHLVDEIRS